MVPKSTNSTHFFSRSPWHVVIPSIVVGLSTLFYVYEFFLRVIPSAITHELMRDFHINAAALGIMSAGFYYAYTPMQIPAGLLCDRFGPRRLLTLAVITCSIATFLFAGTTHLSLAALTRILIGFASAFAFIGPLMLAARWFPPKHFALVAGTVQLMGCLGAIVGGKPVAVLAAQWGWRQTLYGSAAIGLVIAILFWLIIRDRPYPGLPTYVPEADLRTPDDYTLTERQRLRIVCKNKQTWWTAIAGFCCWAPMAVFAELWGVPFLMQLQHISSAQASANIAWIWIGVALSSPLVGWWSNRIGSRRIPLILCFSLGALCSSFIIFSHHPGDHVLDAVLLIFGVSAAAQPVTFGLVHDNNPASVSGTAVGFNNMAVIAGGSLLQPLVGLILQHNWSHTIVDGAPIYSIGNYHHALMLMPAVSLLGLVVSMLLIKETHCQPSSE